MVIDSWSEFPYIRINENDLEIIKEYFRKCSFYNVSHEKYFHIITKKAWFEIPDNEKIKITVLKNENNEKN